MSHSLGDLILLRIHYITTISILLIQSTFASGMIPIDEGSILATAFPWSDGNPKMVEPTPNDGSMISSLNKGIGENFRTTANAILGKWKASVAITDLTAKYDHQRPSKGSYPVIVYTNGDRVIAEDASGTVVDQGVDAAMVINRALLTESDVLLCDGTYIISGADIIIPKYGSLRGESNTGTILHFDTAHQIKLNSTHSYAGYFQVTGAPILAIGVTASHNLVENVTATLDNSQDLTFMVWVSNTTLEDIEFRNSSALECGRTGFYAEGDGETQIIKNLKYINCRAINCGKTSRNNDWVVGFDLAEGLVILDGLFMQDCYATGSWESGFHLENSVLIKNSIIEGCISNGNGRDKVSPTYASGFFIHNGVSLKNCTANENVVGVTVQDDILDAGQLQYIDVATQGNTVCGVLLLNSNQAGDAEGIASIFKKKIVCLRSAFF